MTKLILQKKKEKILQFSMSKEGKFKNDLDNKKQKTKNKKKTQKKRHEKSSVDHDKLKIPNQTQTQTLIARGEIKTNKIN